MLRTLRIGLVLALVIPVANSQDAPGGARNLDRTLTDLGDELRRIEQLLKALSPAGTTEAALNLLSAQESYQQGRAAAERHDYDAAIAAFNRTIQLDPRNEAALLHRGQAYLEKGNLDMALVDLNQSLAVQPDNSRALELRAGVYRARKAYDDAARDLQAAGRLDPNNTGLVLAQASLAEERGDIQAALDLYAAALTLNPTSQDLRIKRAAAYRKGNRLGESLNECTGTIALDPANAAGYICRAESYVRLGQMQPAIQDLDEAMRLNPMAVEAGPVISAVWREVQLRAAAAQLKNVTQPVTQPVAQPQPVAANPQVPSAPGRVPVQEAAATKPEPPAPIIERLPVRRTPMGEADRGLSSKQALYYTAKGRDQIAQERYETAIADLTKAIELDPSYPQAYNSRGYAYLRARDYARAIADFTEAIRLNAKYANAYRNRGSARQRAGDEEGARKDLQIASVLAAELQASPKSKSK